MPNVIPADIQTSVDALTAAVNRKLSLSGSIYDDTTSGLANTVEGKYFTVVAPAPEEFLIIYRHDAGAVATEIDRFPNKTALDNALSDCTAQADAAAASAAQALAEKNATQAIKDQTQAIHDQTALLFDNFDDRFLGSFTTANQPTTDNDGNTLLVGAVYYNTTDKDLRFWNGTEWEIPTAAAAASASSALSSKNAAATSETNAAASASSALGSKNAAATSETNAAASASSASTSAGTATTKASEASASASTASTKASEASTSASNAAASASAAAGSASSASSSASAAATSKTGADTAKSGADASKTAAAASASAAAISETNAANSASTASAGATTATNKALEAAASALALNVSAIAKAITTTAVDVCVYDTSRDYLGGLWRYQCRGTSWENEPLVPGKWLGTYADRTSAVNAGGVVGDYYYSTSGSGFYQLTNAEPVQVYRGNRRRFPSVALIVAEASRVVIYDADDPSLPMWMVATRHSQYSWVGFASDGVGTGVAAKDGKIAVSSTAAGVNQDYRHGLVVADFVKDGTTFYRRVVGRQMSNIATRNSDPSIADDLSAGILISSQINTVAITTLPDAPIDLATGLPAPTIAVATNGGVSVIKQDGTVASIADSSKPPKNVAFDRYGSIYYIQSVFNANVYRIDGPDYLTASAIMSNVASNLTDRMWTNGTSGGHLFYGDTFAIRGASDVGGTFRGLQLSAFANKAPHSNCYITSNFNTGWLPGDIQGAWLSDTVAESIGTAATELVTNGGFATDTANWSHSNSDWEWISGKLRLKGNMYSYQTIPTVAGQVYEIEYTVTDNAGSSFEVRAGTGAGASFDIMDGASYLTPGTYKETFRAAGSSTNISLKTHHTPGNTSLYTDFDKVSVRPVTELVANGAFNDNANGWTFSKNDGTTTASVSGGILTLARGTDSGADIFQQTLSGFVVGKTYTVELLLASGTATTAFDVNGLGMILNLGAGKHQFTFTASGTTPLVKVWPQNANTTSKVDSISIRPAVADRSVKNKGLAIHGQLTKAAVATGAELVGYAGYSVDNYLETTIDPLGTADFCLTAWAYPDSNGRPMLSIEDPAGVGYGLVVIPSYDNTDLTFFTGIGGNNHIKKCGPRPEAGRWSFIFIARKNGQWLGGVNGATYSGVANTGIDNMPAATRLRVGRQSSITGTAWQGSLSLVRFSKTAPTADQIAKIYRDEKPLFQPGAACTLYGTSDAVTALAHDPVTDLLHVGTSAGRSVFDGLRRVENTTQAVEKAISAVDGLVADE